MTEEAENDENMSGINFGNETEKNNEVELNNLSLIEINFNTILCLLEKNKFERTKTMVRILSTYLCEKYNFFKQIKEECDHEKVDAFVDVLHLETFEKGESIINFGEEGEKLYILLEGKVGIYKPKLEKKLLSLKDLVIYLNKIKYDEKNELKLKRIEIANQKNINLNVIMLTKYDYTKLLSDASLMKHYFIEEDILFAEKGEGEEFGEVSLINNVTRTGTVKAHSLCHIASIDKFDYFNTIRKLEKRKYIQMIEDFKKSYKLIKYWNKTLIISLLGDFTKVNLGYGDVLYEQNTPADDIYFSLSGGFDFYCNISQNSLLNFNKYVMNSKSSLVNYLIEYKKFDLEDLELTKSTLNKKSGQIIQEINAITKKAQQKNMLIDIKLREEEIQNGKEVFKIKIKSIHFKDIIGLEEALELKARFCTVKCSTTSAEVYKIKLDDFLNLINNSEVQKTDIGNFIIERKKNLLRQLDNFIKVKIRNKKMLIESEYNMFLKTKKQDSGLKSELPVCGIRVNLAEVSKTFFNFSNLSKQSSEDNRKIMRVSQVKKEKGVNISNVCINRSVSNFKVELTNYKKNSNKKNLNKLILLDEENPFKNNNFFNESINNIKAIEKGFDKYEYRRNLENKNFEEVKIEISKVIGSSIISNPKRFINRTFEREIISINNNPKDEEEKQKTYRNSNQNSSFFIKEIYSQNKRTENKLNLNLYDNTEIIKRTRSISFPIPIIKKDVLDRTEETAMTSKRIIPNTIQKSKENLCNIDTSKIRKINVPMEIIMKNFKELRKKKSLSTFI